MAREKEGNVERVERMFMEIVKTCNFFDEFSMLHYRFDILSLVHFVRTQYR